MDVLSTIPDIRRRVRALRAEHGKVAFVPTMGNLHEGHMDLVAHARRRAGSVVVSIYVNPLQFGENEDFSNYPRTLEADREALVSRDVAALFLPDETTMYPRGTARQTRVVVPELGDILCGAYRPGHFEGVATVVARLLNIVGPDIAVFGRKDYQQLAVIRRMVEDLAIPVDIHGVPITRAEDGLALSSRNRYLDASQRAVAANLYRALETCAREIRAGAGIDDACRRALARLEEQGFRPDYLEVRRQEDLSEPVPSDRELVVLAAAHLGRARLIDNVEFQR
jgi:pantoate--beta-alanine ligase